MSSPPDWCIEHPPAHPRVPFNSVVKPTHSGSQDLPENRIEMRLHPSVFARACADADFKKTVLIGPLCMAPSFLKVQLAPAYEDLTDADVQHELDRC